MIYSTRASILVALVIWGMAACSTAPRSPEGRDDLVRRAAAALTAWNQEIPGVEGFARQSVGYAMFPDVAKGGIGIGGAYGRGVVYERGQHIGYAGLSQGTLGLQFGGQAYKELIVFDDKAALERFKQGRFDLSAATSAILVKWGYAASVRTVEGFTVFYKPLGGFMREMVVAGQSLSFAPR